MKKIIFHLTLALLFLVLYSCSKNNTETVLLTGNWNVVNDSSLNTNKLFTLSSGDSGVSSSNYIGEQCPATFDLYSGENLRTSFVNCTYAFPAVDSAKYILAGNQIIISVFAQNAGCCSFTYFNPAITRTYTMSNMTTNTATLTFNSGMQTEIINLKK